ncbi:MAG TPA: membrane protein insertion efficiency factor YidD [Dehalococcoidia bacterium]|nr:membrane protein insertion efficiency factor YidD [Dehalococcoidia bacterium]
MKRLALVLIRAYQLFISPLLPPSCRFYPTCSQYAYEAIAKYGIITGGRLAIWRLLRCNPFCRGGLDPVPDQIAGGVMSRVAHFVAHLRPGARSQASEGTRN